jgi:hypothetical protein
MKKVVTFLLLALLLSCESSLEPPNSNTDYKNIIGNPVKIDNFEVAEYDFPRDMNWDEANKACEKLGNDWRLPTKDDLNTLYIKKDEIGSFTNVNYWSSTEADTYYEAWLQNFLNGVQNSTNKSDKYHVRVIRSF